MEKTNNHLSQIKAAGGLTGGIAAKGLAGSAGTSAGLAAAFGHGGGWAFTGDGKGCWSMLPLLQTRAELGGQDLTARRQMREVFTEVDLFPEMNVLHSYHLLTLFPCVDTEGCLLQSVSLSSELWLEDRHSEVIFHSSKAATTRTRPAVSKWPKPSDSGGSICWAWLSQQHRLWLAIHC